MKQPQIAMMVKTGAVWLLTAAAPPVGAQTPAPIPKAAAPKAAAPAAATTAAPAAAPAAPAADNTSYLFGLTFGEQMHRAGVTDHVSLPAFERGIKDGLHGKKATPEDQKALNAYVRSRMEAALAHNQAAAKAFLARNSHEKGVMTTASGLQYKIFDAGNAQAPPIARTDQVTVHYRGTLLDGSEFDSSYARGVPVTFPVTGVIPGWQEALVMMKPGAKWELYIPPELAYGATPKPTIPGGSLLIFDVELLGVKTSAAPAAPVAPSAPAAPAAPAEQPDTPAGK